MDDLRAAVQRYLEVNGETYGSVAARMGWLHHGRGDVSRLKRRLGIVANHCRRQRTGVVSQRITYRVAEEIARAIHVDPVEVGL